MSQRVNISYSVELDELGTEVQRLLKNALIGVQKVIVECNEIDQEEPLTLGVSNKIDSVRRQMAAADIIFNDVSNIINGYLSYMTADASPQASEMTMENLKQKIDDFKEESILSDQ
jgi:hypothetical protein